MKSKKIIFVEGKDKKIIHKLARKLGFTRLENNQNVPIIQLGGFSEWRRAVNAVWAFKNILNVEIDAFCLLDRDYRSETEAKNFLESTSKENMKTRVFERKEIENYLCDSKILSKALIKKVSAKNIVFSGSEIEDIVIRVTERLKSNTHSQRIGRELAYTKKIRPSEDPSTTVRRANAAFEAL